MGINVRTTLLLKGGLIMFRNGKKRLDLWLSEDHPIFKVNPGERTRVIESLGSMEVAMSLIADMKQEMLDNFSQIKQAIARIEETLRPGQIKAINDELSAAEQAGEFDINSIYKGFGSLATAQNDDKRKRR
jgi:hypothetical protein